MNTSNVVVVSETLSHFFMERVGIERVLSSKNNRGELHYIRDKQQTRAMKKKRDGHSLLPMVFHVAVWCECFLNAAVGWTLSFSSHYLFLTCTHLAGATLGIFTCVHDPLV